MDTSKAVVSRRLFLRAFAFAGASGFISGCAGNQQSGEQPADGSAGEGYMLSVALPSEPAGLDPAIADSSAAIQVMAQAYESLLQFGSDSCEPAPCLAELPEVSADGLTYTFAIRKGIKFHDGSTFDAKAAKQNIERQLGANRTDSMPLAQLAYGSEETKDGIASVEATDANTLVIKLRAVNAAFAKCMAMCAGVPMVAPSAFKTAMDNPVGTGPFVFGEWQKGDAILLQRNEEYWDSEGKAHANGLIFRFVSSDEDRVAALKNGSIDIANGLTKSIALSLEGSSCTVSGTMGTGLYYLACNTSSKSLADPKARLALFKALDVPTIVEASMGKCAEYARSIAPPHMVENLKDYQYAGYDEAAAKDELKKLGVSKLSCIVSAGTGTPEEKGTKALADTICGYLANAGVTVEVEALDAEAFDARAKAGTYDLCVATCVSRNADPLPLLEPLASKDAVQNIAHFADEAYNKVVGQVATTQNGPARTDLVAQCEAIVATQAPWLPLCYFTNAIAQTAPVTGAQVNVLGAMRLNTAQKQ